MAIKSIDCEKCGAAIEIDDDKEYGICSFCGHKMQLCDIVHINHKVELNVNRPRPSKDKVVAAGLAFKAKHYTESREIYAKVLEEDAYNYEALYRRAICAVYLSYKKNLDIDEFSAYMGGAIKSLDSYCERTGQSKPDLQAVKDEDIKNMLICVCDSVKEKYPVQPFLDDCTQYFEQWLLYIKLIDKALTFIDTEKTQEAVLTKAIEFCELVVKINLNYKSKEKDRDGNDVENVLPYKLPDDEKKIIESARKRFAGLYNVLPSRVQREQELEYAKSSLNEECRQLRESIRTMKKSIKSARADFWQANPESKAARLGSIKPGLVVMSAMVLIGLVMVFIKGDWTWIGILVMIAGVCIGMNIIMNSIKFFEKGMIPEGIHDMEKKLSFEKGQLKEKIREHSKLVERQREFKASSK